MKRPEFWDKDKSRWKRTALMPAAWLYKWCHRLRYNATTPVNANIPVVCVGNVTAGGTGKTPVALEVARHLMLREFTVHFLSRGYGGSYTGGPIRVDPTEHNARHVGDEPLMLARSATTWVSPDRVAAAEAAFADGAEIVIMDDGFQNPSLKKDLSIIVFDGECGIGNGALLPAGPLREPLSDALTRVHAAVVIGKDCQDLATTFPSSIPVFTAEFALCQRDGDKKCPVIAFAGIGRPEKFFSTVKSAGYYITAEYAFPDHHRYTKPELAMLRAESRKRGAQLMTTEKDFIRLEETERVGIGQFPVTLAWSDDTAFSSFLDHQLEAFR